MLVNITPRNDETITSVLKSKGFMVFDGQTKYLSFFKVTPLALLSQLML